MAQSSSLSGHLFKLSGDNQRWQKRWFVLKGNQVEYYKKEGDSGKKSPRGVIDLQLSFGARTRNECHQDINWPNSAGEESSFGVATAKRTWYMYADNEETAMMWVNTLSSVINQSGQPQDAKDDVKGKPESQKSKIARMFGQWFGKGTQMLADSGVIENDEANTAIGAAGTTIQEQAEMDPTETSAKDRFKAGAGTAVETAGELTGDDTVSAVAGAAANQIKADDDAPMEERLAMLGGDAAGAVDSSGLLGDVMGEIATNVGEVITDNAEHIGTAGKKLRGKEEEDD